MHLFPSRAQKATVDAVKISNNSLLNIKWFLLQLTDLKLNISFVILIQVE